MAFSNLKHGRKDFEPPVIKASKHFDAKAPKHKDTENITYERQGKEKAKAQKVTTSLLCDLW
ncbi:MAG: hypothetical protein QXU09_04915 [Thermoproteota archaeon]